MHKDQQFKVVRMAIEFLFSNENSEVAVKRGHVLQMVQMVAQAMEARPDWSARQALIEAMEEGGVDVSAVEVKEAFNDAYDVVTIQQKWQSKS